MLLLKSLLYKQEQWILRLHSSLKHIQITGMFLFRKLQVLYFS